MRWRGPFVGLVGVLAGWLVVWWLWTAWWLPHRSEAQDGVYVASGYLDAVALFLRHDWLAFEPASQQISLAPGLEGTPAAEFFEESYLEDDVAAFNAGDLSVFRVENGRILAIDPHRRNVVLPFTEARSWQGRLTFRPSGTHRAELSGAGAEIELTGPSRALSGQLEVPQVVLPGRGRERSVRRVFGEAVNVVGEGGVYLGQLHLVGDAVVFNYRNLSPGASVSVSGERVPLGNRVRLGSGDLLKLEWRLGGRQSTYALLAASVAGPAPVISSYRAFNGRWQRWPERPDPPFAADVVAAMDAALRRRGEDGRFEVPTTGAPERLDLALTLDGRMQRQIEERLARFIRSRRQPDEPPFRAAVTVMDVATGDLLALASFPQPEDLPQGPDASPAARRLLRNHNLARLPIGSVAKVPFAAAILDAAPVLGGLSIPEYPGGEMDRLLGLHLDPPLNDHPVWGHGDGRVDFEEFLQESSNRYAAMLFTLATAVEPGGQELAAPAGEPGEELPPAERFYLSGVEVPRRPALRLPVEEADDLPQEGEDLGEVGLVTRLELLPFVRRMGELFDVAVSKKRPFDEAGEPDLRRRPGQGDDLIDTSVWLPLLAVLYGEDEVPLGHPFYGVSPERTHLAFNLIDDFRREYLSLILGGGSSTWTNPHVAAVFARLATGTKVRPNLVGRIDLNGRSSEDATEDDVVEAEPGAEPLGMDDGTRQRLMDALTLVASPQGTAGALAPTVARLDGELAGQGAALGFFSKTGSPDVVTFEPTRTARALDELIRVGALRLDSRGRIVYRDTGPVDGDATDGGTSRRSLEALRGNASDTAILRRHRVSPRSVVRSADTFNDSPAADRGRLFEVSADGRLVRARAFQTTESIGAAFAFVAARYPAEARRGSEPAPRVDVVGHQPERGYAVSIVIEGLGNGPDVAVPFARELLEEVLWDELAAP